MRERIKRNRGGGKPHTMRLLLAVCACMAVVGGLTAALAEKAGQPAGSGEYVLESEEWEAGDRAGLPDTESSARVLYGSEIATAEGVGRIPEDTAQGRLLGRRAALTDARRNLLILRKRLVEGKFDPGSVSGTIAEVSIHSEKMEGGLYFLEVDVPLKRLLKGDVHIE